MSTAASAPTASRLGATEPSPSHSPLGTYRPLNITSRVGGSVVATSISDQDVDEFDPRAAALVLETIYCDMPSEDVKVIHQIAVAAYKRSVLQPTRSTWRKEEGSRKELEREVERTSMRDMAQFIKMHVDEVLGPSWHVAYGRSFATYVSHERMKFVHLQLEGANIVVWKYGGVGEGSLKRNAGGGVDAPVVGAEKR